MQSTEIITNQEINNIFTKKLNKKPKKISKVEIGFSTDVYNIDNKYILRINKLGKISDNCFKKAYFLYDFFKDKIPCPEVLVFDDSYKIIPYTYGIYKMIKGNNLTDVWHTYTDKEKEQIIKQICDKLLIPLYKTKYSQKFKIFKEARYSLNPNVDWHDTVYNEIIFNLLDLKEKKLLDNKKIKKIETFISKYHPLFKEAKIFLTFWDLHFNNVIVKNKKVVGFIDFDAIVYASLDNPLAVVKRMMIQPKAYVSKEFSKNINSRDYNNLLVWYKKYFPEMFDFKDLDKRLDFYLLSSYLKHYEVFAKSQDLDKRIEEII